MGGLFDRIELPLTFMRIGLPDTPARSHDSLARKNIFFTHFGGIEMKMLIPSPGAESRSR